MAPNIPVATLNDGNKIPLIGYGTWCQSFEAGPKLKPSMKYFIEQGGRHFDGATLYCNEKEIAEAVRESGIPRQEFFITTKVWITDLHKARESLEGSLQRTGLDYFDLLLVHWPQTTFEGTAENPDDPSLRNYLKVWREFETFPATGKVKSIGELLSASWMLEIGSFDLCLGHREVDLSTLELSNLPDSPKMLCYLYNC